MSYPTFGGCSGGKQPDRRRDELGRGDLVETTRLVSQLTERDSSERLGQGIESTEGRFEQPGCTAYVFPLDVIADGGKLNQPLKELPLRSVARKPNRLPRLVGFPELSPIEQIDAFSKTGSIGVGISSFRSRHRLPLRTSSSSRFHRCQTSSARRRARTRARRRFSWRPLAHRCGRA